VTEISNQSALMKTLNLEHQVYTQRTDEET